jgi:hypothetical protein
MRPKPCHGYWTQDASRILGGGAGFWGAVERSIERLLQAERGDWDDFLLSRNSVRFAAELPRGVVPNLRCERAARMPSAGITLTCNFLVCSIKWCAPAHSNLVHTNGEKYHEWK